MTNGQLCKLVERVIKKYRLEARDSVIRNKHMNDLGPRDKSALKQKIIDALLVDFLNFFAVTACGMDLGMYTSDLLTEEKQLTLVQEMDEAISGLVCCMPDEAHRELTQKWYTLRKKLDGNSSHTV